MRDKRTPTLEQAVTEGWYRPNEMDGLCHCGCGGYTKIANATSRAKGSLKGHPHRFLLGHGCDGPMNPNYGKKGAMTGVNGPNHPGWKGGRKTNRGYVEVWIPANHPMASMRSKAGYVREHRLVMAMYLGRPLVESEIVHHRNHVKDDNRLQNLEIVGRSGHTAYHAERARLAEQVLKAMEAQGVDPEKWLGACGI